MCRQELEYLRLHSCYKFLKDGVTPAMYQLAIWLELFFKIIDRSADIVTQEELGGIPTQVLCGRTPHLRHQGIHIGCELAQ